MNTYRDLPSAAWTDPTFGGCRNWISRARALQSQCTRRVRTPYGLALP